MRHLKQGRHLSRTASHRKALLASLSVALIKHKRIQTTTAKAKETRRIIEPLITRARDAYLREKSGEPVDVHARRVVAKFIHDRDALQILFSEIAEKVGKRPGGYTRVLKLGNRLGDGAEMSVIELVDYNEAQDDKKRRDRVARSKAANAKRKASDDKKPAAKAKVTKSAEEPTPAAAEADTAVEEPVLAETANVPDAIEDTAAADEAASQPEGGTQEEEKA